VASAPYDATGGPYRGVVKVFDSTTGALLFNLSNPAPDSYSFGNSVAILRHARGGGVSRDECFMSMISAAPLLRYPWPP
jgi:hypothetical protein